MKKMLGIVLGLFGLSFSAQAQDIPGIGEVVSTAIRAVDLEVQRIQTKTIVLQEVQKVVENTMSSLELDEIRGWVEQQRDLYSEYFDELWQVKAVITDYHIVKEAIQRQEEIVAAYQAGLGQFRQDGHFSAAELGQIESVFGGILKQSEQNLERLTKAISPFSLQMTDQQRMAMADGAAAGMDKNYRDLVVFTQQNQLLSLQRAKDENDYSLILKLYGL